MRSDDQIDAESYSFGTVSGMSIGNGLAVVMLPGSSTASSLPAVPAGVPG